MMEKIRERCNHLTIWLHSDIKKALYVHWETDEGFMYRRLTNKANRALSRSSKYTISPTTFMKTTARLSKSLDRDAMIAKIFKYTHILKENKEIFADQRATDHYQSQHIRDDGNNSATSEVDPNTVWHETASEPYKNCIYGLGSFFADNLCTFILRPSSTFATNQLVDLEDGVDLKKQMLELTQSLHH
ncbi:hypothetical protein Ahy_B06g084340 [Arachis hypogaea]|uniref:Uncharacterized protein n=1 Tax=Arachis hypogaea TaxID=3818 RepID=A0A444YRN3_ARAHY|nr:hypothetical protein Ahy_B06g084340 [Arachis hypogaea]